MKQKEILKTFYNSKQKPEILKVPSFPYVCIKGEGNPNSDDFANHIQALYAFSYTLKMSYKSDLCPSNYEAFKVFPLEGHWDLIDYTKSSTDKDNYKYTLRIQQPFFCDESVFKTFKESTIQKKKLPLLEDIYFENIEDNNVCQMLHIGPYDNEIETFDLMEQYCVDNRYKRSDKTHIEIYLGDPRKADQAKLKTLLRFKVAL